MDQRFTALVEDTDIKITGVQIDTVVVSMALGVEFHRGLLLHRSTSDTSRIVGFSSQA